MTQMTNLRHSLRPGELRKATRPDGSMVEVGSVAGGSFTQVVVRNEVGVRLWNRSYQFETSALNKFAALALEQN